MGSEFRGKGVRRSSWAYYSVIVNFKQIDVQLGPVAGPLGRHPTGGRNWEGFSPDP